MRRTDVASDTLLAERRSTELEELQEALLGRREVRWVVEDRTVANSYRLRNVGSLQAREVTIGEGSATPLVGPGAAAMFTMGQHPRAIEVSWRDDSATHPLRSTVDLAAEAENGGD